MNVNAVSPAPVQGGSAAATLNQTFDNFLTLLTTQLKHQDPISPMDTNEFTSQLVQFSQVEQSIAQNEKLNELIALQGFNQIAYAAALTGKNVQILGDQAKLTNGEPIEFGYKLPAEAEATVIAIRDAQGRVIFSKPVESVAGERSFVWDGTTADGRAAADGRYTIDVVARDVRGTVLATKTSVVGRVDAVELSGGKVALEVHGAAVDLTDVLAIRDRRES